MKRTKMIMAFLMVATLVLYSCDTKKSEHSTDHDHSEAETNEQTQQTEIQAPDYSTISSEIKDQINTIFKTYLDLKNAFVSTNNEEAKKAAQQLASGVDKVDSSKIEGEVKTFIITHVSAIKESANQIASAKDIESQRSNLDKLSSSLYLLMKSTGSSPETVYYQYCPMAQDNKGGYWISENEEIKNPYFGDKMMSCSETKETLSQN